MHETKPNNRYILLCAVIVLMAVAIVVRLFSLQIVQGETYREQSEKALIRSVPIKAPRGEILDRYGRPLVTNKMGFTIMFQNEYIKEGTLNKLILNTIKVMDIKSQDYIDTLPITKEEPFEFDFPDIAADDAEGFEAKITDFRKSREIKDGATAEQCITALKDYYKIEDGYSITELRKIIGVRYEMENRMFNNSTPYTFATDVSVEAVTIIKEQANSFTGIDILVEPIRQNANGQLASHILGRVGVIYKEEYDQLKDKDYAMNDIIGKDGIEKLYEEYLKGTDGVSSIERSVDGRRTNVLQTTDAVPGNYVVLTIDSALQEVLEDSLRDTIRSLGGATAGSGVVLDVNSGEVLAMASYPTFNASTFNEDYKDLLSNPNKPMWNRAISGQYAPGSTFKPLTAIAALEEGVVTRDEIIVDQGVYNYYKSSGYTPVCWIYTDYGQTHGAQNVTQAIENSCNYYFYEAGRRLGIDNLAKYGKMFGLGETTGIELEGEAKGIFASKEYRQQIGQPWYPGDNLQAAIGQSDHLFTPLQLASYIATLANGGTRYKTHLVKDIKSYETDQSMVNIQPEVVAKVDIDPENWKAVMEGMRKVSESGTASNIFSDFDVPVGGKTGTASVPTGAPNGLFVAFAPYDNPQIAIAIVVEHGEHGTTAAPIAKNIISTYMSEKEVEDEIPPYNTLIKN